MLKRNTKNSENYWNANKGYMGGSCLSNVNSMKFYLITDNIMWHSFAKFECNRFNIKKDITYKKDVNNFKKNLFMVYKFFVLNLMQFWFKL